MAEKNKQSDPQLGLIVAELRKLNAVSRKDLIRDKEDRDRAERMAAVDEVQVDQQSNIMSAGQDFQRRFLAGQAKTFLEKGKLGQAEEENKPSTRGKQDELRDLFTARWKALDSAQSEADRESKDKDKEDKDNKKDAGGKSSFLGKAAKGAAGLGLMGLGIGAFMSGLMVWSGVKAFRGEGFPEQAKNISEGWEHFGKMSNKSITMLGVMLAGGAFLGMAGGVGKSAKAAIGMTAMGAGIGGFMSGVVAAGSLTGFDGKTFKDNAADVADALEELGTLSTGTLATLGLIAVAGAGLGYKSLGKATGAAAGASLAGAAIGGFMTGIVAVSSITKIEGTSFKDNALNTVEALKALETMDVKTLAILGVLAGGGALMATSKLGIGTTALAATGASIAGASIGGFMVGMSAPAALTKISGTTFKDNALNTVEALKALETLDAKTLGVLGLMAGAGAAMMTGGKGKVAIANAGKAAAGASIMGAGIGGFMVGMTAAAKLGSLANVDGKAFKDQATNIAEGLGAFTGPQQLALSGFIIAGAGLGAAMPLAAAGMTAMGAGIGGFFAGLAGVTGIAAFLGADGAAFGTMLNHMGGGLAGFNQVNGANLTSTGLGLVSLGAGIAALGTALFGTGTADTIGDTFDGFSNFFNMEWLSGKADKDTSASGLQTMIDNIVKPMESLATIGDLTLGKSADGISKVVNVMNQLTGMQLKASNFEFTKFTDDFVYMAHGIDAAFNGGKYAMYGAGNDLTITTGLKNLSLENYQNAAGGIRALQEALGVSKVDLTGSNGNMNGTGGTNLYNTYNNYYSSEAIKFDAGGSYNNY
jgi:hypothetical protein